MSFIVHHHLGLGDFFICNGLVNSLAKQHGQIFLACKEKNYETIGSLYKDNSQVKVFVVRNEPQDIFDFSNKNQIPILHVGFQFCDLSNFESSFYLQLGYDPQMQYSAFTLPLDTLQPNKMFFDWIDDKGKEYVFVHNQSSLETFNLHIESKLPQYIVKKSQTANILDYVPLMLAAKEIHLINSSIQALVWPLLMQNYFGKTQIFFHDFSQVSVNQTTPIKVPKHPNVKILHYTTQSKP